LQPHSLKTGTKLPKAALHGETASQTQFSCKGQQWNTARALPFFITPTNNHYAMEKPAFWKERQR